MADIDIVCPTCGHEMKVSEYVDPVNLNCPECSSPLALDPGTKTQKKQHTVVKGPRLPPPVPEDDEDEDYQDEASGEEEMNLADTVANARENMLSRRKKPTGRLKQTLGAAGLGLGVAGILYATTNLLNLPGGTVDMVNQGGVLFIFALWAAIAMLAFKDDVFQGMLCTLIPGYWLYYLFFQADNFYVRGLAAGFLAIYGVDFVQTILSLGQSFFQQADSFISGENRDL